jgi:hypothetical protein
MDILIAIIAAGIFGFIIYRYRQIKKAGLSVADMWNFKKKPLRNKTKKSEGGGSIEQLEQPH